MKKKLALILCLIFLCGAFIRCEYVKYTHAPEKPDVMPEKEEDPTPHKEKCPFADVIKEYDKEEHINGYSIKGRKYIYDGRAILILFVSDETGQNNSLQFTVDFLDADGNSLRTVKQSFEGFSAGWSNYFVFQSRHSDFEDYVCTLETTPYDGIPYSGYIQSGTEAVSVVVRPEVEYRFTDPEILAFEEYTSLDARFVLVNFHSKDLFYGGYRILFDNQGEIYSFNRISQAFCGSNREHKDYTMYNDRLYGTDILWENYRTEFVMPEELTGEVSALTAFTWVKPAEEWRNTPETE